MKNKFDINQHFNEFYQQISDSDTEGTPGFFFLPDFVKSVSKEWSIENCGIEHGGGQKIEGSKVIFESRDIAKPKVVTKNGNVYRVVRTTKSTGSVTWNGDDEYFPNFETIYSNAELVDVAENIRDVDHEILTAEKMETMACELVSILSEN